MAKNTSLVLLGYDDEPISDKQTEFVDFTTNKIGGKPVSSTHCSFLNMCTNTILKEKKNKTQNYFNDFPDLAK